MEQDRAIGEAIVYIENNLYEPITAAMVSEAVSYSYYHFHRYFLLTMGETIGSYIRSRRLTQAGYELIHSNKKIIDIAFSLCFESAESFARAFKKKFGLTPRDYRKNGVDVLIASHPAKSPDTNINWTNFKPEIVSVPQKHIVGFRYKMSVKDNQSVAMWERLNRRLCALGISTIGNRYSFYELGTECHQTSFHEGSEATALIGVEWDGRSLPEDMSEKVCKGGKYAKFIHKGKIESLLSTYRHIWGVWFPQSGYRLADREDFECYTDKFLGPKNADSEIEIYFPIQDSVW